MFEKYDYILDDLRHFTLFPRSYGAVQGRSAEYWSAVSRRYSQAMARVDSTDWRWHVIQYKDGREELAYLRVLSNGFLSGRRPALYRGIVIPRRIELGTFDHIKEIRLAF